MSDDNLPILYQNIIFGLPSAFARDAFLWAVERPGECRNCYRAEAFAREAARLVGQLVPLFDKAGAILSEQKGLARPDDNRDVLNFILTRHANWRYGGNLTPSYLT